MVKHIVCWKLTESAKNESTIRQLRRRLKSLVGSIDGLRSVEVGAGFAGDWDAILYTEFDSRAALEAYRTHPAHVAVQKFVHSVICDRTSADYELD